MHRARRRDRQPRRQERRGGGGAGRGRRRRRPQRNPRRRVSQVILASTLTTNLTILVLAGFVGFAVISKVPNTLHTPLMSGTNAIHGIVLVGALLVIGMAGNSTFNKVILVIAIAFGTINIVGGFLVTDRMLEMFKRKPAPPAVKEGEGAKAVAGDGAAELKPPSPDGAQDGSGGGESA